MIYIIWGGPFPHGMASTIRIYLYALGLKEASSCVKVLMTRPTEKKLKSFENIVSEGNFEGVDFQYTCGRTKQSNHLIGKIFWVLFGSFHAAAILLFPRKTKSSVIIASESFFDLYFFRIVTYLAGLKFIVEKSELPLLYHKKALLKALFLKTIIKLCNGIIVISDELKKYFEKEIGFNKKILKVPIIYNPRELELKSENPFDSDKFNIVYNGDLSDKKDGISILIESFSEFNKSFPQSILHLLGRPASNNDLLKTEELVKKLKLTKQVLIKGFITRNKLISFLNYADLLVLTKPFSVQSKYAFPTKLAEYLGTGKPVLVTNVGELKDYLIDNTNAFIAEPTIKSVYEKMVRVSQDLKFAKEVGIKGKELAENSFDYRNHCKLMLQYIQSIK